MKLRNELLAAVAAVALIGAAGSVYAQDAKIDTDKGNSTQLRGGGEPTPTPNAQMKAQGGAKVQAQSGKEQGNTTQLRGGGEPVPTPNTQTQMKSQGGAKVQAQGQSGGKEQGNTTQLRGGGEPTPTKDSAQAGSNDKPAQLSETQRTQISTTVSKQSNLRRVERNKINFTINVGAVVPRTVNLAPLPAPILAVVPAYRGYLYIVVGDDLLIVHPRTYEIVAVIPA